MIVVEKWQGLITEASPYALPGGAMVSQVNLQCRRPGQVELRPGYTAISASAITGQVVSAIRYASQASDSLLVFAVTSGGGAFHTVTGIS